MKAKGEARFDVDTLRELAGAKAFARGVEYFRDGSVHIVSVTSQKVQARVVGSEDYRAVLHGSGTEIDGECSCPAFSDWGFCKHLVATALAVNAAEDGAGMEAVGSLPRIREHLKRKDVDALVEMILELAEQNSDLFRKLDMASSVGQTDDKTLEARLRKSIDAATHTGGYLDYREAPGWHAGVDAVLDVIGDLVSGGRSNIAFKLIERAIERIESAFEQIDDSDGHLGSLLERARDIHLAAAGAVRPEPVALARDLFKRETASDFDTFTAAAELYADVLGEQGLAEYRHLAAAAWKKLPSRSGRARAGADASGDYYRLVRILDFFAERDGDVEARIALRAKDLSSQWSYLQLAEFCLSQGREDEALRHAEEGLWQFEDDRLDERLLFFTVTLLCKARRKADAEAYLGRAFEKVPSLEVYKQARKVGGAPAAERALTLLETRAAESGRTAWNGPADLLVDIHLHEKQFDAAWSAVRKYGASRHVLERLAHASDASHPCEALEVYATQVDRLANAGGDSAYAEASKLVGRMAKLRSAAEQLAFVAELKARHGRKRNLMKLLG